MRKMMVLAAMLVMMMVAAAPALAETQTSGAATAGGATLTAGDLANQAVQVANNVNTGNVDQDAAITNIQVNLGALAVLEQTIVAGEGATVTNVTGTVTANPTVNQTVEQNAENTITQSGITQINNAQLTASQAIAQVIVK